MSEVAIRDAVVADLDAVARLHVAAFPDSVLGQLGLEAVRRSYQWQMTGPHDLTALVAVRSDEVVGFLFGGVFRGSTIGFLKTQRWFLVKQVVLHPAVLVRAAGWNRLGLAARLLARRSPTPLPEQPEAVPRSSFGVLAIAVDPATQGAGVGRLLMAEASSRAVDQGFESMHLTVNPSNENGLAFYQSLGWSELCESDGQWRGRLTLCL